MQNPYGGGTTAPASGAGTKGGLTVADLVAGIGGLVVFIFSFLTFFEAGGETVNAWNTDYKGLTGIIAALLGLALAAVIGVELAGTKMPDKFLTFNWDQVKTTWAVTTFLILVGFIAAGPEGLGKGAGFWLMLLGSIAMVAGTIMKLLGAGTNKVGGGGSASTGSSQPQPPPGGYQQPGGAPPPGGYQQPGGSQQPGQDGSTPPPPPSY